MKAYVLINVRPGKEREVVEKIKESKDVKVEDICVVYGEYDIILKIDVESLEKLREFVMEFIRKIEGVERTTTLISAIV